MNLNSVIRTRFNRQNLREGYVIHVHHLRGPGILWRLIQWALGDGSHDALVIRDPLNPLLIGDDGWGIGELVTPKGRLTCLANYEAAIARGQIVITILRPKNYDPAAGIRASDWFIACEVGKKYAWRSYLLLPLKILGDWINWPLDVEWQDWCTESCMWSWLKGAGGEANAFKPPALRKYDYWRRPGDTATWLLRPTPLTTVHRLQDGILEDCSQECLILPERTNEVPHGAR